MWTSRLTLHLLMSFLSQFSAPTTTVAHTRILSSWPFSLEKFLVRTQAWVVTRKWCMRHTPFLPPFHAFSQCSPSSVHTPKHHPSPPTLPDSPSRPLFVLSDLSSINSSLLLLVISSSTYSLFDIDSSVCACPSSPPDSNTKTFVHAFVLSSLRSLFPFPLHPHLHSSPRVAHGATK